MTLIRLASQGSEHGAEQPRDVVLVGEGVPVLACAAQLVRYGRSVHVVETQQRECGAIARGRR